MDPIAALAPRMTAAPTAWPAAAASSAARGGAAAKTDPRLTEAAQGFEAIFLRQILKDLRKTAVMDGEKSAMSGIYTEMFDEHLADQLAKAGGIGLGQAIRTYLKDGRR
jgi:Rod binding domain-containing protein